MIQPEAVAFTGALVWMFPELMPAFGEHLVDNEGEVLPHVFMAQVERWAEQLVSERSPLLERHLEESAGPLRDQEFDENRRKTVPQLLDLAESEEARAFAAGETP